MGVSGVTPRLQDSSPQYGQPQANANLPFAPRTPQLGFRMSFLGSHAPNVNADAREETYYFFSLGSSGLCVENLLVGFLSRPHMER
jgi:hypothetical protein